MDCENTSYPCPHCDNSKLIPDETKPGFLYCNQCDLSFPEKYIYALWTGEDYYYRHAIINDPKWKGYEFFYAQSDDIFRCFAFSGEDVERIPELDLNVFQLEWLCEDGGMVLVDYDQAVNRNENLKNKIGRELEYNEDKILHYIQLSLVALMTKMAMLPPRTSHISG